MNDATLTYKIHGKDVDIKEITNKIVGKIITAKDFISAAASSEPHAALAWAGVCLILPVSKTVPMATHHAW